MTREEAMKALEGCWDGIEEDGLKIRDLIEAHFEMVERVKEVKEVMQSNIQGLSCGCVDKMMCRRCYLYELTEEL